MLFPIFTSSQSVEEWRVTGLHCPWAPIGVHGTKSKFRSSKITGENRWPVELTDTTRTPFAATRALCNGEREVSEEVTTKLKFEALRHRLELGHRHDARVVDQNVEWTLAGIGESPDGPEIRQIERFYNDGVVAG